MTLHNFPNVILISFYCICFYACLLVRCGVIVTNMMRKLCMLLFKEMY